MPNLENEKAKRRYFEYLRESEGNSTDTIDAVAKAINQFEEFTGFKDFKTFSQTQAIAFKRHLCARSNRRDGKPLAKATLSAVSTRLVAFFSWLAAQPGYKSKFTYAEARYFNLSDKDMRVAKARQPRKAPTQEQLLAALLGMPVDTESDLRDRAVVGLIALTGVRDRALVSLKMKHVDLENGVLHQDGKEVATKFGKTFDTFFFPVDAAFREALVDWMDYQRKTRLKGPEDPLFPANTTEVGSSGFFEKNGLSDAGWADAGPVRKLFRKIFTNVGLPYFNPHSVRNMLVSIAERLCRNAEQFKALSQNLGHENVSTTLTSYGAVHRDRQRDILRQMNAPEPADGDDDFEQDLREVLKRHRARS